MTDPSPTPKSKPALLIVVVVLLLAGAAIVGRDLITLAGQLRATPEPAQQPADSRTPVANASAATASPASAPAAAAAPPTLTPLVVTPPPPARDPFEAATRSAAATETAREAGPGTPTPPNLVTATFTPKPLVVTPTPVPGNAATAEYRASLATAIAFTTGTPTPPPGGLIVATFTPAPPPTSIFVAVEAAPQATATLPAFPPELAGKILFASNMSGRGLAYAIDPSGSGLGQLTADWPLARAAQRDPWSPDGTLRAGVGRDLETGQVRIQVTSPSGTTTPVVAANPGGAPAWSPVGARVAYVSNQGGNEDIWAVNTDGTGKQQLTANKWAVDQHPSWSPDGTQMVFMSNRGGKRQVWIMNADGSDPRLLTGADYEAWDPVWVKLAE